MARLFGTDGVRGIAGEDLTPGLAMLIGRGAATVLTAQTSPRPRILIGKDTRISGDMLEAALSAGLCSVGADVELLGVIPTPAVAYLVRKYGADAGIVISASHNPMEFNGIKIFNGDGYKLPDEVEDEIEHLVRNKAEVKLATGAGVGRVTRRENAVEDYVEYLAGCLKANLSGLRVAIDCANGAAAAPAQLLFTRLGAECHFIGVEPDGVNINEGCGSTHIANLASYVVEHGLDCGVAFDGDADRCLAVDEKGAEIDGDKIIAVLAKHMREQGALPADTAVVTVMSNLGFMQYMREVLGLKIATTAVGDRYVLEEMRARGYAIGGEQSGHVILLQHSTTGDGELTAGTLLNILAASGGRMSGLTGVYEKFPQVILNVNATPEEKARFKEDEYIAGFIESQQQGLMGQGRVLVRVSGTEPYIRVMVEGRDQEAIAQAAQLIVDMIEKRK
ncbi:phosphoglucosamine mutase [Anaerofilum sp. BX8]|uniref:Phosphoglucosamine mutase n=1 Tax=Anaerofilum hominis TaxID=2763016 RepID=A0A923I8Y8_9FIRM|nr:phosphoglucosamine mutase [Anaerofilum hominis]MBC5580453.1 phosphoglucosamine mutase [Anaerofilum hominis]